MQRLWSVALLTLAFSTTAAAQQRVDLTTLDAGMTGPRTQMLVLASTHLSQYERFNPATLEPVLTRLVAFNPTHITIEAISGEQCDLARRHAAVYGDDYCASTDAAQRATGLAIPEAITQVDKALATWSAKPTPADRRRLASLFLAAGEPASAYVQWLQLAPAERRTGDGLDDALVTRLTTLQIRNNESLQIGSTLAARLGLQRVYAVDDHTGDAHRLTDRKAFGSEIEKAWASDRAALNAMNAEENALIERGDMLALYRAINQPQSLNTLAIANVRPALAAVSAQHYPQIWVNGWELRNLRMVGNILQVVRDQPGSRVLNIVGASHKPWFDAWLGQMSGVQVVDTETVLK